MLKFLNLNPEIFGIDINDLSLRIVKLKKKRNGFSLVSYNEADIKPGVVKEGVIQDQAALAGVIKTACKGVKGKKLDTKYAAVSLPEEKSFSQVIEMPQMTDAELITAVPYEAENYIPLTIDKVYMGFQTIGSDQDAKKQSHLDLLINVMPKTIVDAYVSCLEMAGIVPCILEVESQAVVRALADHKADATPSIFVDFGRTKTGFIIFSDHSIRFTSSIPIGSDQLTQAIAAQLHITADKAEKLKIKYGLTADGEKEHKIKTATSPILQELVSQIKKYISFHYGHLSQEHLTSDGKIGKIVLCGGGSNLKGFEDFLCSELKIPVQMANPFNNISQLKRGREIPYQKLLSFTTAVGLAKRGASDKHYL